MYSTSILSARATKEIAKELGFFAVGIAETTCLSEQEDRFRTAIQAHRNSEMIFLEKNIDVRFNPKLYWQDCQSVIVVLFNYNTDIKYEGRYKIAKYAYINDYHTILKEKIKQFGEKLRLISSDIEYKITVDTAPLSEKNWAVQAGLGHIGKNSLLISKNGSFCFIGTLLVNCKVDEYDQPNGMDCGSCDQCMHYCPTGAIVSPYCIDTSKCIAYQSIESKNPNYDLLSEVGWIYGCDECQDACPHNKNVQKNEAIIKESSLFLQVQNETLPTLSEELYRTYFKGNAIQRRKYDIFIKIIKNKQNK